MSQVKSTYNFVPAPEEHEVFIPSWADQVSHDIPFEDGESGEIEIEITAETPIFIREGISQEEAKKKTDLLAPFEFSHYFDGNGKKHFFIPATSIKGMTRNTLEILSFSKMLQFDKTPVFGLRDMNNKTYANTEIRNTKTGWLLFENGEWAIRSCDSDRVTISSIISILTPNDIKKDKEKIAFNKATAKEKYISLGIKNFNHLEHFSFIMHVDKTGDIYELAKNGNKQGQLVLFGSMDNKKYDYIFQAPNYSDEDNRFSLEHNKGKCFLLQRILEIEKDNIDSLWHYFVNDLKLDKIPVFFKEEKGKVKHFGFSKLYRLNNGHSIDELAPKYDFSKDNDLATTIFGHTNEGNALKGRVYFSNALNTGLKGEANEEERILSTPNPSYYPFYLNQDSKDYTTYVDPKKKTKDGKELSSLKGFKRYPVHNTIKAGDLQKDSMSSKFKPLKEGNQFTCKVRFHNLKKQEIGALVSALTFHNSNGLSHSLGGGKPYGFGKVKIEVVNKAQFIEHLYLFEQEMDKFTMIKNLGSWINTKQVKEIVAIAKSPVSKDVDNHLNYPQLELPNVPKRDANEFNNYKKNNQSLRPYSAINGTVEIRSVKTLHEEKKNEINKFKIEQTKGLRLEAKEKLNGNLFDEAIQIYRQVIEIYDDGSLDKFENEVNSLRLNYEIEIDFNLLNENSTLEELQNFIDRHPNSSDKIEETNRRISILKALSGIPENVSNKNNLKQFADNTDNWVKKLKKEDISIESLGYLNDHKQLLFSIWQTEKSNLKLSKEWHIDKTKKRFIDWYGEDVTNEIILKLN